MANTLIQIKRSLTTAAPASLNIAEPGYSYSSNIAYIGTPDGTGTIAIGGKAYMDLINSSYVVANAAFGAANSASGASGLPAANQAGVIANAAFTVANSAFGFANGVATNTTAAFAFANGVATNTTAAFAFANGVATNAAAAFGSANTVGGYANTAGLNANQAGVIANAAFGAANQAGVVANNSNTWVNSTFVKLTAASQTINGDLAITGNLTFTGNAVIISSNTLAVGDSLFYLAANNYSGTDTLPIGFIANYGNTTAANVHTGLVRNPSNKEYYLFNGYDIEPGTNNQINFGANNMTTAVLVADLISSNVWLGGTNAIPWITASFGAANQAGVIANSAFGSANTAGTQANGAGTIANAAFGAANQAGVIANAAFGFANGVATNTTAAFAFANGVATNTTAAFAFANGVSTNTTAAFGAANQSGVIANAAFGAANTAGAYANNYANASNLSSGTVPSARISGSYTGITGVGTITIGTWNGTTVNVGYGGTGIVTATQNGVLYGGGGNAALQVTAAGTEGQVLTASATGVPQFSMISGGTF